MWFSKKMSASLHDGKATCTVVCIKMGVFFPFTNKNDSKMVSTVQHCIFNKGKKNCILTYEYGLTRSVEREKKACTKVNRKLEQIMANYMYHL